jgi:hypothetical protein
MQQFYETNKKIIENNFCTPSITTAVQILRPDIRFGCGNDNYDELTMFDLADQKPSREEIDDIISMLRLCQPFYLLRKKRDELLKATDIYTISDYPISPELREAYFVYRRQLRDLPATLADTIIDIKNIDAYFPQPPQ